MKWRGELFIGTQNGHFDVYFPATPRSNQNEYMNSSHVSVYIIFFLTLYNG